MAGEPETRRDSMDDSFIREELRKCEKRRNAITEKYSRDITAVDAEIRVYRRLLDRAEGKTTTFSQWLTSFIEKNRFSNNDLGELIGMSDVTIGNWRAGKLPSPRLVGEIARKLCDLDQNGTPYDDMVQMMSRKEGEND